jgi:anti-sigma B factor antagonist
MPVPTRGLRITYRVLGPDAVVAVRGEIDVYTGPPLRTELAGLATAHRHLLVDLTAVTWLDSTGLGVLIGVRKRLHARGHRLLLVVPPDSRPHKVLAVTALDGFFAPHPTLDDALAALESGAA